MKLLSRSALVAFVATAGLLTAAVPSNAYSGCALSKLGAPDVTTSGDGPGGFWATSPDSNALGAALGGLGAIAALLTGGTVLLRQRYLAQEAAANAVALAMESDLSMGSTAGLGPESAIAEPETELALGLRR